MVPVKNFPMGLPEEVKKNELTEDEMKAVMEESGETLNVSGYFLLDQCVRRSVLGKGVRVVKYFMTSEAQIDYPPTRVAMTRAGLPASQ